MSSPTALMAPPSWQQVLAAQAAELPPDLQGYRTLCDRVAEGDAVADDESALVDAALAVLARPGFDTFVSLPRLRFEPYEHQLRAATRSLRQMRGRAILADEVGLGKTIEACLVLSELRLRGLADRVLVVVPAGLLEQWQNELDQKFSLPSVIAGRSGWTWPGESGTRPVVLASLQAARRDPLRATLLAPDWDLVIADEAHRLKNPRSASSSLIRALRARNLLLLTATPVENRLDELFQLVSLVRPGQLGTARAFRARHGGAAGQARRLDELRAGLRSVMVRHRRSELGVLLPGRLAETLPVRSGADEAALYAEVSERVRERGRGAPPSVGLALRAVLRAAGSSPPALAPGLDKLGWSDLADRARGIEATEKVRVLLALLERHGGRGEKVVVFTSFRRTLEFLAAALQRAGHLAAVYHGSLPRAQKEEAIRAFRGDSPVLVTTEAAGEGRNLQFCHVMVNFDLPWNPMQIEQRLGRIHRIGQDHDVVLANLVGRGTLEEQILRVLESKINLFELVVGELDMILGRVAEDLDFESLVYTTHVETRDDAEFRSRLEAFGEDLAQARRGYLEGRSQIDAFVEPDEGEGGG